MKLSDGTKSLIYIGAGIIAVVLAWLLVISGNMNDIEKLKNETQALNAQYNELLSKEANREQYKEDTIKFNEQFEEIIAKFPATLNQENTVMFVKGMEVNYGVLAEFVEMGIPQQYYVLGSGTAGVDGNIEQPAVVDNPENQVVANSNLITYKASFPVEYVFIDNYEGLKQFMDYVINYKYRAAIDSFELSYNKEDDQYKGKFTIDFYAIYGDRPNLDAIELEDVKIGTNNIFAGSEGASSGGSKLNLFDGDNGAAIETSYDYFVRLNPTTSDVAGKLVGMGGTNKAANDLSSNENTSEKISFDFTEVGDKRYLTYSIGDESKEVEVTASDYATILIQSSDFKDDADKNKAVIAINNTMSIPVYVKVVGDDTASRVKISKSGSVKTYQ